MTTVQIQFIPEELEKLTAAVRQGAAAIASAWEVLTAIGTRIGRDWEPNTTSVRDIMDCFASHLGSPEGASTISLEEVSDNFIDSTNWSIPK